MPPLRKVAKTLSERERLAVLEGAVQELVSIGGQHANALAYTVGAKEGDDYRDALVRLIRGEVQTALAAQVAALPQPWYRRLWRSVRVIFS